MEKRNHTCKTWFLIGVLFFSVLSANAATYYSRASGNWNSTTTWSTVGHGSSTNTGTYPVAGDLVYLASHTITLVADGACTSITVDAGYAATITVNSGYTLTVSGAMTLTTSTTTTTSLSLTGAGSLSCASVAAGTNVTPTTSSTTTITTTISSFTVSGNLALYSNRNGTVLNNATFTETSGTVSVNGSVTSTNEGGGNVSTFTLGNSSPTLNLGGATPFSLSGTGTNTITLNGTGATVNYNYAGAQTVYGVNYTNLSLSTSGTKTLQTGTTAISGNLTLNGTASTTTVVGLSIGGNLNVGNGTTFTAAGFALSVTGTTTVGGGTSGTLTISSATGTKTFTDLVTINSGATWNNSGNSAITIQGGITNSGTFTAGTGVYTFNTNSQSVTGTLSIPSITVTGVTLTNNNTLTVATALSGTGELSQAANATLNIGGTSGITTLTATNSGNTVNYSGAAQTVKNTTYNNLTLSNSGAKTISSSITVSGILSMEGSATTTGTTPSYGAGSTIRYYGSTAQATGTELPATFSGSGGIIINNASGVSLSSSVAITYGLTLTSGALNVGAYTLTLNGPAISGTPTNLTTTSSSSLAFGGSSSGITIPSSVASLNNLTINNVNGVSMTGNITLSGTLTLTNGSFNVASYTLALNGPAIAGTPSNLATTSSSGLSFGGSSAGVSIPASVTNLRNLTINNASGVTLNSNVTLATNGILTLSGGVLNASTHTLFISNSAASAVVYTAGSFVNVTTGSLQRTLPAGLSGTGNDYLFPIGESNVYKGMKLVDVNTGTTGPILQASVSATGALTGDNTTIGPVDPRYWSLINTNSGDFTSAGIELTETGLDLTKTIGMSSAVSGNYTAIGGEVTGSTITTSSIDSPGPYFCVGTLIYITFYSYQTGSWQTISTWTIDPSGTLQIGNRIPGKSDHVVILTDRTVTLSANVTQSQMEITINAGGILDLSTFRFTKTIAVLAGQGTLRLATVDFPTVTTNTFVNSGGGTTEYYNSANFTLPATQTTYNNLTINSSGFTATQLSNLTLNGTLLVKAGTFRINDNTSTTKLSLTVNGNVNVNNGATIAVGQGVTNPAIGSTPTGGTAPFLNYYLNFHTVIIKGDFTNNGTASFTNLAYPLYTAFPPTVAGATSGAASVYFQGSSDNTLTCNGPTTFYNLIVNKGTDQTYKLTVNSTSYSYFRLFGANSLAAEAVTGNPTLRKALWIYSGTLVLKGTLIIPSLSEGTVANADYYIPANGAIMLDGVDVVVLSTADDYREVNIAYGVSAPDNTTIGVTKGGYSALDVFGKFQLNNGYLSTRESGGIITSSTASGQIIINNGTIDAKQLLASSGSASYSQTGGIFILRGRFQRIPTTYSSVSGLIDVSVSTLGTARADNGISSGYGSFNLENTTNIYNVSGGTIRIYDVTLATAGEAFDVKCSSSNINVTGGLLEIMPVTGTVAADATSYLINTTAPVYDFTINRISSTSVAGLSTSLVVQNDLNLSSGGLTSNNNNVSIGGDLTIASGTTYTPGTNTTILNGSSSQTVTINLASALSLSGFTINKASGVGVTIAGSQETLNVTGAFNIALGTLDDGGKTINVSGATIYNSGIHTGSGAIVLNGTVTQTIDGNGVFQNVTLNNTNAVVAPVSLLDNMTVTGALTFSQDKIFNIGIYNLHLNSGATIVNGSSARFIQTAGNAGDGGLSRTYASVASFVFPVGVSGKYTPATIGFTSAPSTYGSITVIPVDYEHPVTTINGQSLTYFWRVKSSGFTGIPLYSVTHSFVYDQTDVVGTETSYVPSLYDITTHSWYNGQSGNINTTTNTISDWTTPTNSTNFLDADYTAGISTSFGTPRIYYSRQSGLWSTLASWSLTSHIVDNPPTVAPGANDIVIIGGNDSIYLTNESFPLPNNNNPAASYYSRNKTTVSCASLQIEKGSALDIQNDPGCTFATVLSHLNGNGTIRITTRDATNFDSPEPFVFPAGDFTEFNNNDGVTDFYTINPQAGTYYTLPSNASSYGTVLLTPLGGSNIILPNLSLVTIHGDLICNGSIPDAWLAMTWNGEYGTVVAKTVTVQGDLKVVGGSFGFIYNGATLQQITINGDVYVYPDAAIDVWSTSTNNAMSIGGSLYNNSNYGTNNQSLVRFLSGANICNVTFFGNTSSVLTNNAALSTTPYTVFNKVTVNKGSSQATTLTWNIGGTLTTPSDNWLTLQNGTLIYNRTGDFNICQGTDFTIPSTSGLTLNTASNVYISNNAASETLYLNGKLTVVTAGNVYIGPSGNTANNADIEYSGSGASAIEVQGGNMFVNGQIRRPTATTNGILSYTQSGGNVVIYGNNATATKAKLEVLNNGSYFGMSGGNLTIVRGSGTTFGDLYLRPETSSVTGGTITFSQVPSPGTTIDVAQAYSLDANIPLYNLTITGKTAATARNAALTLMVSPLTLGGTLTISNANSSFTSNNLNVTIAGNMVNSGTYTYGTNTTTFNGGNQTISGTSATNFYNLNVSSVSSLTVNNNFSISSNLTISPGNLVLNSYKATLSGNLSNNGSYTDDNSTGGVGLEGSSQQTLSGTGSFGRLILNNSAGAKLSNSITLHNNLVLTTGILDIGSFQLTLGQSSQISGGTYSNLLMIKSDGVSSSLGVVKYFNTGAQSFTFPVGVAGKYTPATFTISASSAVGSIKVNPVDNVHPTVTDPTSSLKYYWQIESSGITGFTATALLQYLASDVSGTESSYVAARLDLVNGIWDKATPGPSTDNVDETNHRIAFYYTSSSDLNGDYTAGVETTIPDEVATYQTNSNGYWSDESIWTPVGTSPACPDGGPSGCNVIINHVVTTDINHISALNTTINGQLTVVASTYGHDLGNVDGTGVLHLESGTIPAGTYTEFFDCAGGGTLEYGGTGTYTIIASLFSSLPNLTFTGTGTRVLPNKDLTICNNLIINGPTLDNSVNNKMLTIMGSMQRLNGSIFSSGTGSYPNATVVFAGTAAQTISGSFTGTSKLNNFVINNANGLTINSGGAVEVNNSLILTSGVITTSSSGTLTVLNTSTSAVTPSGGSTSSYISGPLTKYINNGDAFIFPVGKGAVKGHTFTLTSTTGTTVAYTAEFFTPNTTATSITSPLQVANTSEYWSVSSQTSATAYIKIAWDPQSDLTPLVTTNGISDMRVAEYIAGYWTELTSTTSGNNYYGDVATSGNVNLSSTAKNYTTAAISGTLARAALSPSGPVCGTAGIPVTFTSFNPINLNYILSYTINGNPQTDLSVTSLPYILPTPVSGAYRLTGFRYNNGSGTGVVDATIVTAYDTPTNAAAGTDQSLCGLSSTTLEGNSPSPYSGLWTIVSGSGGSFTNSIQYNTPFNGTNGVTYTLRWTISNGGCTSSDDVIISFPVVASTPGDFTSAPTPVCAGSSGNIYTVPLVSGVTYNWSYSGTGHTITGSGNSVSISFSSSATSGTLGVTATNSCGTSSPRTVNITIPVATFSYTASPYCQNSSNPTPTLATGGQAGTFTSSPGLTFISSSTGQIDLVSSVSGTYTVTNTVDVAGCGTLIATSPVTISGLTWTGTAGTNWNTAGNWSCGFVPYQTTNIVIPDVANDPILSGGSSGTVNNIVVDAGALLTISGNTLEVSGTLTNSGTINATDAALEMNGSSAQVISANIFNGNTIRDLIINNPAGVTLQGALNVTGVVTPDLGNLASNGYLTLISNSSGTALIAGSGAGTISGNVTIQRYLASGFGYKYFSSAFQAATVNEFSDDMNLGPSFPMFYRYDESRTASGWVAYNNPANILNPMQGYAANFGSSSNPNTADITGIVNNGPLSVTLYNHNNTYTKGFNLVGNPYPSPIDWDATAGWTKTNIDNAIYYFSASATDQYGGTYSSYVNGVPTGGTNLNIIPSLQGFFVHVSDLAYPVTGTLAMDNNVRITDRTHPFLKSLEISSRLLIRLTTRFTDDSNSTDPTVIYFDNDAEAGFESDMDALKLFNTDLKVPNIYSVLTDGRKLSINALPQPGSEVLTIPLGLKLNRNGEISFKIRDFENLPVGTKVYITDAATGTSQDLLQNQEYKVSLTTGEYIGRFSLGIIGNATDIDDIDASSGIFNVYNSNGALRVEIRSLVNGSGVISIYDLGGQLLFNKKVFDEGSYEFYPKVKTGLFVVRFTTGNIQRSQKVLIND